MDAASSTPSKPPVPSQVNQEDRKKVFLDSLLESALDGSSKDFIEISPMPASNSQTAHEEAKVGVAQENHLKGETVYDKEPGNSLGCSSQNAFASRTSISSDVDNETYYSLDSDHENATSPDNVDGEEDYIHVDDSIDVEKSHEELPAYFSARRDIFGYDSQCREGDQPDDISREGTLIESSSSAESLSGWEDVHHVHHSYQSVLASETAFTSTGQTHWDENALAGEMTSKMEMESLSNFGSDPTEVTLNKARLSISRDHQTVVILSSQEHGLSTDTEEQAELSLGFTIDFGPSGKDLTKLEGQNLGDKGPSSMGRHIAGVEDHPPNWREPPVQEMTAQDDCALFLPETTNKTAIVDYKSGEAESDISERNATSDEEVSDTAAAVHQVQPGIGRRTDSLGNPAFPARFFEVTNVAATSGGICKAQELMIHTGYNQENRERFGLPKIVAEIEFEEPRGKTKLSGDEEQELYDREIVHPTDESKPQYTAETPYQKPDRLTGDEEPLEYEWHDEETENAEETARRKVEKALQSTNDTSFENSQLDIAKAIPEKSVSKRVSFSSVKSQMSDFHAQPTFPVTELHKWPANLSLKRNASGVNEVLAEDKQELNAEEETHESNDIDWAPEHGEIKRGMTSGETIELSHLKPVLAHLIGDPKKKDNEGVDNPTFVMEESGNTGNQVAGTNAETLPEKPSTMRSLIKETYLPRLKPTDHLLQQYPDRPGDTDVTAEQNPEHVAIRLYDAQGVSNSNQTATKAFPAPWLMNEYFGCSCILFTIILVIIFCVVLRTYFPLHYGRHSS